MRLLLLLTFLSCFTAFSQELQLGLPIGHNGSVSTSSYSPDGKMILTCSYDQQIFLWDAPTGKIKKRFYVDGMADGAEFCGEDLILVNFFSNSYLMNIHTEEIVQRFEGPGIVDESNGQIIIFSENKDGYIRVYNIEEEKFVRKIKAPGSRHEVHFSSSKQLLFYTTYKDKVILDVKSKKKTREFEELYDVFTDLKVGPKGKWISLEHDDGVIDVFNEEDESYRFQINTESYGPHILFRENDEMIVFKRTGEILRYDLNTKTGGQIGFINTKKTGIVTTAKELTGENRIVITTPTQFAGFEVNNDVKINFIRFPNFNEITGVKYIEISPTSKECLVYGQDYKNIVVFDPVRNEVKRMLTNSSKPVYEVSFSEGGNLVVGSEGSTVLVDLNNGSVQWNNTPPEGSVTVLDLSLGRDTTNIIPSEFVYGASALSHNRSSIALINKKGGIRIQNISEPLNTINIQTPRKTEKLLFSKDDNILFSWQLEDTILYAWNVNTGELISEMLHFDQINEVTVCSNPDIVATRAGRFNNEVGLLWYVPTGQWGDYYMMDAGVSAFGFHQDCKSIYVSDGTDSIYYYSIAHERLYADKIEKGVLVPFETNPVSGVSYMMDELEEFKRYKLSSYDALAGKSIDLIELEGYVLDGAISDDGKYMAIVYLDHSVELLSLDSDKAISIWRKQHHLDQLTWVDFSPDGKFFVSAATDGSVILHDLQTGEMILQRFQFDAKGESWLHVHPSGLFDASAKAMELMYWRKGMEIIDFAQLKDRYWVPGLWKKVMNNEDLPDVRGINELKLQPKVELEELPDGELGIKLIKRDGGYGQVSIWINGKEVINDARGENLDTTKNQQLITYSIKDHPFLTDTNTIEVRASSADGFVRGKGELLTLIRESEEKELPNFYAIVIGVDKYVNEQINLKFPSKDAKAIAQAVELGASNLFGTDKSFVYTMTSDGDVRPEKESIQELFTTVSKKAKADDILMVYLSGHGITWGGENGDFYFLTADATSANKDAFNDPVIRNNNSVSTKELVDWIKTIPALKQVMIIDACGSGKAVDNLIAARDIEASQIKAIDRMKDRTGMFVISGCAADAVSYEASQYGQGLLTYAVLQAMKGAALKEDKYVDVFTLLDYARDAVPQLAGGLGGIQEPQFLIPKGGSFDIGMLDEADKLEIPLSNPKTVFVRSTFVESSSFEDELKLSLKIDEKLNGISGRGEGSDIIWFDTREYPNACKLSGGYESVGDEIHLKLNIRCGDKKESMELSGNSIDKLLDKVIDAVNDFVK